MTARIEARVAPLFLLSACGGPCAGFEPLPAAFDDDARIERAVQLRVSSEGFRFAESILVDLAAEVAPLSCTAVDACPTGFTSPSGTALDTRCDEAADVCVDAATGANAPLFGVRVPPIQASGINVCRDDPSTPTARPCGVFFRMEAARLAPSAPSGSRVRLEIDGQFLSDEIPVRVDALGADCLVSIDSAKAGARLTTAEFDIDVGQYSGPGSVPGQLSVVVASAAATVAAEDWTIVPDPRFADPFDAIVCAVANLAVVTSALEPLISEALSTSASAAVETLLAEPCPCPTGTECVEGLCRTPEGQAVSERFGVQGRADLAALIGDFARSVGALDTSVWLGGPSGVDGDGFILSTLGGVVPRPAVPGCAEVGPDPRTRAGYRPPTPFSLPAAIDLDFDGQPDRRPMFGLGLSQAFIEQLMWSAQGGLGCFDVTSSDIALLNTGALGLVMPSLRQLTGADRDPSAIFPVRLTLRPSPPSFVRIGSGEIDRTAQPASLVDPLITVGLDDLELALYAVVEARWVRLLVADIDLRLALGLEVIGPDALGLVIDDDALISDVRVRNAEILAESNEALNAALPVLVQLAVPALLGDLPSIPVPGPADLSGFSARVVGVRGTGGDGPDFEHAAIFADLSRDPATNGVGVDAAIESGRVVDDDAGRRMFIALSVDGDEASIEAQYRLNGGPWHAFQRLDARGQLVVEGPSLRAQGLHRVEVRARRTGQLESVGATQSIDVPIDDEPPTVSIRRVSADAVVVSAFDVVSHRNLAYALQTPHGRQTVELDGDRLRIPSEGPVSLLVTDEVGLQTQVVLRSARAASEQSAEAGCRCVRASSASSAGVSAVGWSIAGIGLVLLIGRRLW